MKTVKEYIWKTRRVYVRETTINTDAGGWVCYLDILGGRDVKYLFHRETFSNQTFESPVEAEEAALEIAKKWVDEFQDEVYKAQN